MRAITIPEPGGPQALVWAEVPDPEPKPGEVLVEVTASAVNRADILQRQGHYAVPEGASPYPGLEVAGTVAGTGEPVCALLAGGGYAEKVAVARAHTLPIPANLSVAEAAALPEVACTVWSNVVDIGRLRAGETLLVHGGGSGIGTFAIQLGKALGAEVVTTARRAKHERLKDLGADRTIDHTDQDFAELVRADVILDIIGARYLARNVRALNRNGRIVNIGLQGGRKAELDIAALAAKCGLVSSALLRPRPAAEKARIVRGVRDEIWPLVEQGRIRPVIDRTFLMAEAAKAHAMVETGEHVGKVLLLT
jgi:putative PIG3 family NAD(P)H quinone oxidoreductase